MYKLSQIGGGLLAKVKRGGTVGALLACAAVTSTAAAAFWNLTGDVNAHDPSIIQEGNDWYTFSTGPGLQVLRSTNGGTNWFRTPQIFLSPLSWWKNYVPGNTNNDVWAPDVHQYAGRVWLFYSISTFGSNTSLIGLASASAIGAGSWRDDGLVIRSTSANNYNAIDPNLVIDASGNPWLAFGSYWSGIKLTRLSASTMKPTGTLYSIANRANGIENPTIVQRNGMYYLFASVDKCCQGTGSTYKIVYGRSSSITGPYLDKNGVNMMNGGGTVLDAGNDRWKGPGGQDVHGTGVIARHAYDAWDGGKPKLLISNIGWGGGWPEYY